MLASFGVLLQIAALALLPFAMLANLSASDSFEFGVSNMLIFLVGAVAMFYIGRFIQGYAENSASDDDKDGEESGTKKAKKKK